MADKSVGLYIHIPFCCSKCDYCDFYSLSGREHSMDDYQQALMAHIVETAPQARGYQVDTIYFGGGTPSYYGEKRLIELLHLLRRKFRVGKDAEVTLEGNPDSVDAKKLTALRRAGFNRLSLGMQSANDCELKSLGRPHTFVQVRDAVEAARKAKLKNVSLDLIYGLPGQTLKGWKETVEAALALEPEHLSCYGLTVEEGTPLARRVAAGEQLPDDDAQADCYLWTVERLDQAGFHQYEISNFARPGRQSRHNMKYWMGREYMGFGPGAHSDFGGCRYAFIRSLDGYIRGVMEGKPLLSESENIPTRERSKEYLMLRLRTSYGIEEWEYRRRYYMNFDPLAAKLAEYEQLGLAERVERRWRLTPRGFLLSNQLIAELLNLQQAATLADTLDKIKQGGIPDELRPADRRRNS